MNAKRRSIGNPTKELPRFRFGLLLAVALYAGSARAESSAQMVSACTQIAAAKTSEHIAVIPRDFDSGQCWGAFGVLEELLKTKEGAGIRRPVSGICLPDSGSRTRWISAFVAFAKTHPERNREDFLPVVADALKAAFPCQAKPVGRP